MKAVKFSEGYDLTMLLFRQLVLPATVARMNSRAAALLTLCNIGSSIL